MQKAPLDETTVHDVGTRVSARAVRWGQGPLAFELQSGDAEFLARAATILASWPPLPNARLARCWRVERASSSTSEPLWEAYVSQPGSEDEVFFFRASRATLMQAIEFEAVSELLKCPEAILGLHGGLLSKSGQHGERGVALIGPCLAGKSTLSCALWNSGWSFLSDDVTLFDDEGRAYPAPRRASLRESSRDLVGESLWSQAQRTRSCDRTEAGLLFHPHETDGQLRPHNTRLAAIICLARRNVQLAPAELRQLPTAQAAIALLPYSNLLQRLPFPSALTRMAPLAECTPIYDLGRGPLPAMIAQLDALVETALASA